jgi:antitoxin component of RelBE/YafQ-DinJ toxin-antitoxin module
MYDINTEQIIGSGHDDWPSLRARIRVNRSKLVAICVEQVIMHMGLPPSRLIITTATEVGRIQQLCEDSRIPYNQLPRIDICEKVSGTRPKRGVKVTKTDMQKAVQKLLGTSKFVRPQHANDAACAILAFYPPQGI